MAITPSELLERFRIEMDDAFTEGVDTPLWTDIEVFDYMDETQKEFARRTNYFSVVDTGIVVTADDPYISLPISKYTEIRKLRLEGDGRTLRIRNYSEVEGTDLEDDYGVTFISGHWEDLTGAPSIVITDLVSDKGRLVPIPVVDDTVEVTGYGLPLKNITESSSKFEVTEDHYVRKFTYWMRKLAYEKHDSQAYDPRIASSMEQKWNTFVDETKEYIKKVRRRPGTVRYGGL